MALLFLLDILRAVTTNETRIGGLLLDYRPILYVNGVLLVILATAMILPMLADFYFGYDDWQIFFVSMIVTAFSGGTLILSNMGFTFKPSIKQAFIITNSTWITLILFSAFPFWLSSMNMDITDSIFEATSGLTTTSSTVITGLDHAPAGILLWRALLQWLGGIGIIIMAVSVLPFLKIGGMQIFRTDLAESEKGLPRTAHLAKSIASIYVVLTLACALLYMLSGLEVFDSITHAMTTISTGGFSNFDKSFIKINDGFAELIAIVFMILGSLPFILYIRVANGNLQPLYKDTQTRWFLSIILIASALVSLDLAINMDTKILESLRQALFNVTSIITGTGFRNTDYNAWGAFCVSILFFLMVVGGCAGSTSCGIKIFRFQVLYAVIVVQTKRLLHQNGVFLPHYDGKPIPREIPTAVMSFFFVYALGFMLIAAALSLTGLDFTTSVSGAITSISNVGAGMGNVIGPLNTFGSLPDSAKWILVTGMILGRLEIFTFLVMLTPIFWKSS